MKFQFVTLPKSRKYLSLHGKCKYSKTKNIVLWQMQLLIELCFPKCKNLLWQVYSDISPYTWQILCQGFLYRSFNLFYYLCIVNERN